MTARKRFAQRLAHRAAWPVLLSLVLVACEAPKQSADFRDDFPFVVGAETLSLSIAVPSGGGALASSDADGFARFIRVYVARGEGPLIAETDNDKAVRVRELLLDAGLRPREIVFRPSRAVAPNKDGAVLTFAANTVKVPDCANWSSKSTYNWSNRRQGDFGCSHQRNLGLMVEDPGDLAKPRDLSPRSAPHSNQVIHIYGATPGQPSDSRGVGNPALITGPAAAESTEGAATSSGSAGGS